jgi:hypothetical protein
VGIEERSSQILIGRTLLPHRSEQTHGMNSSLPLMFFIIFPGPSVV